MKKHKGLQALRQNTPTEVKEFIDFSFSTVARIDFLLKKQGKTRRDLAEALGKRESEISKWMAGAHNFTGRTIAKIHAALGEKVWEVSADSSKQFLFQLTSAKSDIVFSIEGKLAKAPRHGTFQAVEDQFDSSELCHMYN